MFSWKWYLKDNYPALGIEKHNSTVFSCFCCGGGSTMGYKLAGYRVLGGLEIDPLIASIYAKNHKPRFMYQEDIRNFLNRSDLPKSLYNLDILDGSPPCTPFSMAGVREKGWGIERNYAEGRVKQTLDDLFLVFIELIKKLQPKIAVIENVTGLNIGIAARKYLPLIGNAINNAGYDFILKQLDSSKMGVPQKRNRLFFICLRNGFNGKNLGLLKNKPNINLKFNQKIINFKEIQNPNNIQEDQGNQIKGKQLWKLSKPSNNFGDVHENGSCFNQIKCSFNNPVPVLTTSCNKHLWHPSICRNLDSSELINAASFPQDYEFENKLPYILGNSVPPVMTANISYRLYQQVLSKI